MTVKILAFAGSTREGSLNKKTLTVAIAAARAAGAEVTRIDLRDLALPLYDGDLEEREGLPPGAKTLKGLMRSHDAFLLACPEYNSSITGALKNAIDWASRPAPDEKTLECFKDKVAGLTSSSPGALGGIRSLATVRSILENIGTIVIPDQMAVSRAHEAFDDEGKLKDPKVQAGVEKVATRLVQLTAKLKG